MRVVARVCPAGEQQLPVHLRTMQAEPPTIVPPIGHPPAPTRGTPSANPPAVARHSNCLPLPPPSTLPADAARSAPAVGVRFSAHRRATAMPDSVLGFVGGCDDSALLLRVVPRLECGRPR